MKQNTCSLAENKEIENTGNNFGGHLRFKITKIT